jgi:hypothetical protein
MTFDAQKIKSQIVEEFNKKYGRLDDHDQVNDLIMKLAALTIVEYQNGYNDGIHSRVPGLDADLETTILKTVERIADMVSERLMGKAVVKEVVEVGELPRNMKGWLCPFCGLAPIFTQDKGVIYHGAVEGCPLSNSVFDIEEWKEGLDDHRR